MSRSFQNRSRASPFLRTQLDYHHFYKGGQRDGKECDNHSCHQEQVHGNAAGPARKNGRSQHSARVSTDHRNSKAAMKRRWTTTPTYIQGRDDWEIVSVYADEGITGCNTKKRDGFNSMVRMRWRARSTSSLQNRSPFSPATQ
jgi:hypothetical protein